MNENERLKLIVLNRLAYKLHGIEDTMRMMGLDEVAEAREESNMICTLACALNKEHNLPDVHHEEIVVYLTMLTCTDTAVTH